MGAGLGFNWQGAKFDNSAFTPTSIAGCVLWLRADLGITISTGVSAWADQSGTSDSNKNCTQSTGSKQPTQNASDASYNNQATLSFTSASSQVLQSGTWASALTQPYTTFIVGNYDGTSAEQFMLDGIDSGHREGFYNASSGTNVGTFGGTGSVNYMTSGNGSPLAMAGLFNNTSSSLFVNAKTAVASGTTGSTGIHGTTLGDYYDATSSYFLNGKIAEVIIYNSDIGATNRASVWSYLGTRYGISIGA